MGSRSNIALVAFLFLAASASYAELTISGTKDFQYRGYSVTGSLNQFLVDHPTFLADRGFRQSLRLTVNGTLGDNVHVDLSLDDTNDIEKDQKLLVRVDGKDFDVTAGRLTLDVPGTRYLLYNKKALAAVAQTRYGDHTLTVLAGRPEGDAARDFFRGRGAAAEYLLRNKPIVQGSEIVNLDGRVLVRGTDYDLDHEEGTLILNRRLLPVEATSSITVEYETQSIGGSGFRSTVLGFREAYRIRPRSERQRTPPKGWFRLGRALIRGPDGPKGAAGGAAAAVPPSALARGPEPGRVGGAVLGNTIVGQSPGYPPGPSAFPGTANMAVPDAFGASSALDVSADPEPLFARPALVGGDDHVGVTFVMSTDSESPSASTSATPRQLGVVGTDLSYRLGSGWLLSGELAQSFLDANRRIENPVARGTAWDVALAHAGPRWDFRLTRQHLGPGFEAVGRREFVRLGEVADLSSDLDLTTAFSRFDLTRSLFLDTAVEVSETNLDELPDRPVRDFLGVGNGLSWAYAPRARFSVRQRDDRSELTQPNQPVGHVTHRVRGGAITQPFGGLVTQLRAERAEDRGIDPALEGDTETYGLSMGDATRRRWKWNLNAQNVRFASAEGQDLRDALSLGGLLDLALSRALNGSLTLLNRTERDLIADADVTTNTGEVRARYQPNDRVNVNSKASAEQRSRIVRVNADPRLALVRPPPGQRTVVAEKPVVATNSSHVVDWQPSKRWDHRASFRHRDEIEVGSNDTLSSNRAAGYRLRWAPGTVFRTTTELEKGTAFSRLATLDRDTWLCVQELLWSYPSGLNLGLSYQDNDAKDRKGTGRERTQTGAATAERNLGRYFTGLAKLSHTEKIQGGRSSENAVGAGLRYALPKTPVRLQLDGEIAGVTGTNPVGAPFDSRRYKTGMRVDGQPMKDLNVEAAVTWVQAGPSALGDNGYEGWTVESKAFFDF
jgi:hypothetical protein